jgi:hypothetical protein
MSTVALIATGNFRESSWQLWNVNVFLFTPTQYKNKWRNSGKLGGQMVGWHPLISTFQCENMEAMVISLVIQYITELPSFKIGIRKSSKNFRFNIKVYSYFCWTEKCFLQIKQKNAWTKFGTLCFTSNYWKRIDPQILKICLLICWEKLGVSSPINIILVAIWAFVLNKV